MVYEMPCPGKAGVFVASSHPNKDQAEQELRGWASGHGYRFAETDRAYTVYGHETQPRQWILLERDQEVSPRSDTGH